MEEQLKEMLGKRPDELEVETLKLFEAIMKIADTKDQLFEENKELKECLEVTSKALDNVAYDQIPIAIEDLILSSIPKSKIKDKIEELDKEEKQELKGTKGQDRYYIKQKYMYKRNTLQELLEE